MSNTTYTPLGSKILIREEKKDSIQKTGSIYTVEGQKGYRKGQIISVSPDIENPSVKNGDIVLFEPNAGVELDSGELIVPYTSLVMKIS